MKRNLAENLEKAAQVIASGGIVAFPTETYYGLAVDPFNEKALVKLFQLKKRQQSKPLLTLIAHQEDLQLFVDHIPEPLKPFMALWPAPLTLIFPGLATLPSQLTGGTSTIGIRISSHPVATGLLQACKSPITATSANLSGAPPCHNAILVREQFGDRLDYILDGGSTPGESGSTLIGLQKGKPIILRDGVMPHALMQGLL